MPSCLLVWSFPCLFCIEKKNLGGGIITFSGTNITKRDQRLGKKCQTVVRTQMSGQSGRKCVFRRVKEHQNHLKRGQGRIVQGDSTQQALCEWNTRRSYSSRCCLLGDVWPQDSVLYVSAYYEPNREGAWLVA